MKYSVGMKFLAVLLCALTLLASILCLVGIAVLEANDLYNVNFEERYREYYDSINLQAATELARKEFSRNPGGCDDALLQALESYSWISDYYRQDSVFYTIRDLGGEVLYTNYNGVTEAESVEVRVTSGFYYRQLSVAAVAESGAETDAAQTIQIYVEKLDVYFTYAYERVIMPTVTVTLHLTRGARTDLDGYNLGLLLWTHRYNIFILLAGNLLLFAMGAVYLCWAAGRKPDSDQIRAGGFNALPLDLYTFLLGFGLFLAVEVTEEIGYHMASSPVVLAVFLLFLGFFCCLLFVAWCFAWAAQLKEGGGRWWRKSVVGWSALTLLALATATVTRWIPGSLKWLAHAAIRLFRFLRDILTMIWTVFSGSVLWVWKKITGAFWWFGRKAERFFSLLPLTWQWVALGGALAAVMALTLLAAIRGNNPLGILAGIGICLGMILYGAYAFGLLLEGTRQMHQGDLDSKIPDRLLIGSFREFAAELNGLADVAKVAVRKEMRSERMKTELITNVSHDIKTPLTSIINYVDLLQKPHTPEEEREYLEVLGRKSGQLKKLIQDLMEMSRASTGNITVDLSPLDAAEAVTQALGEFSGRLEAGRLTPVVTMPPEPVLMVGDGRLVWRVLSNLLSNAVKYALPGTRLYVHVARTQDQVAISLKNISAEPLNVEAEELMERFVRGDAARNTDGSGLGLNIARSLMEVQQGRLLLRIDGDLFTATLVLPAAK